MTWKVPDAKLPNVRLPHARLVALVVAAFAGGLIVASSFDFTHRGLAQSATVATAGKPTTQQIKPLADQNNAFVSIAEHVTPAVVSIQTARDVRPAEANPRMRGRVPPGMEDFFNQFGQRPPGPEEASGSGFIVTPDGYILTNNHVVADADRVTVALVDHRVFKAKVVGRDPSTDVAVIKIDASDLPIVNMGDDSQSRVGEWVLAFGNPLGLDFTVTAGIVSAKGRGNLQGLMRSAYSISDFIQTDAAINPGNSGGPLVNIHGDVIGINSAIASPTGFYSGYGFAIPITLAKSVMNDIVKYGKVRRAVLGIAISEVDPDDAGAAGLKTIAGVKIGGFTPTDGSSPGEKAGLEAGDIIVAADGKPVDRVSTLQRIVRTHLPGQTVSLEVVRFGTRKTYEVKLGEAPSDEQVAENDTESDKPSEGVSTQKLGITVEPVSAEDARTLPDGDRGLRVLDVAGAGPAHNKLAINDIIVAVLYPEPRHDVHTAADLQAALAKSKTGDYVSLLVYRLPPQQQFRGQAPGENQGAASGNTAVVSLRIGGDGRESE
jgi:serine protease Do